MGYDVLSSVGESSVPDSGMVGRTISNYRVIAEIGHGGMAVIYKA